MTHIRGLAVLWVAVLGLMVACTGNGDADEKPSTSFNPTQVAEASETPEGQPTSSSAQGPKLVLTPTSGACAGKVDVQGFGFSPTGGRPHEDLTLQLLAVPGRVSNFPLPDDAPAVRFLQLGVDTKGSFSATIELVDPGIRGILCGEGAITIVAMDLQNPREYASAIYEIR